MNRRIRKKKDKKITEAINGLISIAEWPFHGNGQERLVRYLQYEPRSLSTRGKEYAGGEGLSRHLPKVIGLSSS